MFKIDNQIIIHTYSYNNNDFENFPFNKPDIVDAEKVCLTIAKEKKIEALAYPLFSLYSLTYRRWLYPNELLSLSNGPSYLFKVRFIPSETAIDRLENDCPNALIYFFYQMRYDFLSNEIVLKKDCDQKNILGLGVIDMVRYAKTHDKDFNSLSKMGHLNFVPCSKSNKLKNLLFEYQLKNNFKPYLLKVMDKYKSCDETYIMSNYIICLYKYSINYGSELYELKSNDEDYEVSIQPHDTQFPGLVISNMKNPTKNEFYTKIKDLQTITIIEGNICINHKAGSPKFYQSVDMTISLSIVAGLDGYYRLMENYHFHLCRDVETLFVKELKTNLSHGPVSKIWACDHLNQMMKKRLSNNFMIKLSNKELGNYVLIHKLSNNQPEFIPIIHVSMHDDKEHKYFLTDEKPSFSSIPHLIAHYKRDNSVLHLKSAILPSSILDNRLYLCKHTTTNQGITNVKQARTSNSRAILIPAIVTDKLFGHGNFTNVYRSSYANVSTKVQEAVIKQVQNPQYLQYFMDCINKMMFWKNHSTIVSIFSVCIATPFSVVMEMAPLRSFDIFLKEKTHKLTYSHLCSAIEQIAQALCHLQDLNEIHGNIRCRNVLVFQHNDKNNLVVKLADPGMVFLYNDLPLSDPVNNERLPWIAPECLENLKEITLASDIYSLGITILEIFTGGNIPYNSLEFSNKIKHYGIIAILTEIQGIPEEVSKLICLCSDKDSDKRISAKVIVRDIMNFIINDVKYGLYNEAVVPSCQSNASNGIISYSSSMTKVMNLDWMMNSGEVKASSGSWNSQTPLTKQSDFPNTFFKDIDFDHNLRPLPVLPYNEFIISYNHLEFNKDKDFLGQGHYGHVYKGIYIKDSGEKIYVAIKVLKNSFCALIVSEFEKEFNIMVKLSHENIVKIIGQCPETTENQTLLVMEYLSEGNLRDYLNSHKASIDTNMLYGFGFEIAKGMEYLARENVVHRDLAARNVLVSSNLHLKISDFGLSRMLDPSRNYYKCDESKELPAPWCAPEALTRRIFNEKTDVWSYGITLWEIFSYGKFPDLGPLDKFVYLLETNHRLPKPDKCPEIIYEFIKNSCWDIIPENRDTFKTIVLNYPS